MPQTNETNGQGAIDPEAMRRAEAVIEQLRWTYIQEWAPAAMEELETAVRGLRRATGADDAAAAGHCGTILRVTHDMKGQAGTFGLELLQDFAASLHRFAEAETLPGDRRAELCEAHVTAMRTALSDVSAHPEGVLDRALEGRLREGLRALARLRFN